MEKRYLVCAANTIREWIPPQSLYAFDSGTANYNGKFVSGTREAPILGPNASNIDEFYTGYNIFDTTTGENRQIVKYDGRTKQATLDVPFNLTWNANDAFEIKDSSNWFNVHMQNTASSKDGFYNGNILVDTKTRTFANIYAYNGSLKIASIMSPMPPESLK